jgi:hypothetical protein
MNFWKHSQVRSLMRQVEVELGYSIWEREMDNIFWDRGPVRREVEIETVWKTTVLAKWTENAADIKNDYRLIPAENLGGHRKRMRITLNFNC